MQMLLSLRDVDWCTQSHTAVVCVCSRELSLSISTCQPAPHTQQDPSSHLPTTDSC